MTGCKWDSDHGDYLTTDGDPCRRDEYGDPTSHCTARRTCSQHVGPRELTCAKCLGRVRQTIRKIRDYTPLLPTAAELEEYGRRELQGVNSEAAYLAGPAADVEAWSWRKITAKAGTVWHQSLVEEDDEWHPYTVLTRWEFMIREDYREPRDTATDITSAAAYLDRNLARIAQDNGQDFPLLRRELKTCWNRVQIALAIKRWTERGAPCPECVATQKVDPKDVQLVREYGHWCADDGCDQQFHFVTDEGDVWRCPRNDDHWWTQLGYAEYLEERKELAG